MSTRRFWLDLCYPLIVWTALGAGQPGLRAQPPGPRASVPNAAAQQKARELFGELYGDERRRARTAEEKAALGAKLLGKANQIQGDAAGCYVLLVVAGEIAADAADAKLALDVAARLAARYEVDELEVKTAALADVGRKAKSTAQFRGLAEQISPLIETALAQDDFDSAGQLGAMGVEAARRARQYLLAKEISTRADEVEGLRASHAEFQQAMKRLEQAPTDGEANLTAGRYLCFVKGQWQRGVPMLALGSDAELKSLASQELVGAETADAQIALADAWWAWSGERAEREREGGMLRAGTWYRLAQSRLAPGLLREKVALRLEEIAEIDRPIPIIEPPPEPQPPKPPPEKPPIEAVTLSPKRTLRGHEAAVVGVAFSPDGRTLASCGADGRIKLWDAGSGNHQRTVEAYPGDSCRFVHFSPDGTLLASGGKPHVKLWDPATGELVRTLEGHDDWIKPTVFSPDGKLLASGGAGETIRLWDVTSGRQLAAAKAHPYFVFGIAFAPDGKTVATGGGGGGAVKLWEVPSAELKKTLTGHQDRIWWVAFSPDGTMLASGSADGTAKLWDVRSGEVKHTLTGHDQWVRGVAFSPDSRILATAGWDFRGRLWDTAAGQELAVLKGHTNNRLTSAAFSPDGTTLATGGYDKTVRLWDVSQFRRNTDAR